MAAGSMERRALQFETYDEAIAELDRLQRGGYQRLGQWSLGQICEHLSYYYRGSLDGFGFALPWVVRVTAGRWLKRQILRRGRMAAGLRTMPESLPPDQIDDAETVAEAKQLLARLSNREAALHPSPLFGALSHEEWARLHLIHTGHHLGFLVPTQGEGCQAFAGRK